MHARLVIPVLLLSLAACDSRPIVVLGTPKAHDAGAQPAAAGRAADEDDTPTRSLERGD